MRGKVHYYSHSMFVNAGMVFPLCYAGATLLDMDKVRLKISTDLNTVQCKHCRKAVNKAWPSIDGHVEWIR